MNGQYFQFSFFFRLFQFVDSQVAFPARIPAIVVLHGFWVWVIKSNNPTKDKKEVSRQETMNSIDEKLEDLEFQDQVIDKKVELRDRQREVERKAKSSKVEL